MIAYLKKKIRIKKNQKPNKKKEDCERMAMREAQREHETTTFKKSQLVCKFVNTQ
jgi:hypothetical protein